MKFFAILSSTLALACAVGIAKADDPNDQFPKYCGLAKGQSPPGGVYFACIRSTDGFPTTATVIGTKVYGNRNDDSEWAVVQSSRSDSYKVWTKNNVCTVQPGSRTGCAKVGCEGRLGGAKEVCNGDFFTI